MSTNTEDVKSLNRHALLVLRDMAKTNLTQACYRFGCSPEFVRKFSELSMEEVNRIAITANLVFSLKINLSNVSVIADAPESLRNALFEVNHATL